MAPRDDPVRRAVNADGQSAATRFEAWWRDGITTLSCTALDMNWVAQDSAQSPE